MRGTGRTGATGLLVVAIITGTSAVGTGAELPAPLSEAVRLLGWSGDDLPRIELVTDRPRDASQTAEAWVRFNGDGRAVPIIYVASGSAVYKDAAQGDYQAIVKLAGILAHERWHLGHGRDEVGAYTAQLSVMEYLHANSLHLTEVRKALRWWEQHADQPASGR